jgi:glycerol-3-phosphate dehydrogenase (NAD(P)+)
MQKVSEPIKIAMIGGGSWATALTKILSENQVKINWWLKNADDAKHIREFGNNPRYLSNIQLNPRKVKPFTDLRKALAGVQVVFLAVPAAFIEEVLLQLKEADLKDKIIVSAIKGMIPTQNILVTDFVVQKFNVAPSNLAVIAGPCHSEEIALEKRSYLTIAGNDKDVCEKVAHLLRGRYVITSVIEDLYGVEYCAVMKNIIALACGIAKGLNYGDNFQAVLVTNAMQEIKRFLDAVYPGQRSMDSSAYLGDLLVTCYSPYSRNRTLGYMVGKGYSVRAAMAEMNMIAEGYYAVSCVTELNKNYKIDMPVTRTVYNVLYEKISPVMEVRILENQMR